MIEIDIFDAISSGEEDIANYVHHINIPRRLRVVRNRPNHFVLWDKADLGNFRKNNKDDKKSSDPRNFKENDDKFRQSNNKRREKSRHSPSYYNNYRDEKPRSSIFKLEKDKRIPDRLIRGRNDEYDKNNLNCWKDKTCGSLNKKRDRSYERSRDHFIRDSIRDRDKCQQFACRISDRKRSRDRSLRETVRDRNKRRQSDRRSPDGKPPPRRRSPRSRYSPERELQRPRPQDRNRDRPGKPRESDRGHRSRERIIERDRSRGRSYRETDNKRNYRRDERRYNRSLNSCCKDYKEAGNILIANRRLEQVDERVRETDRSRERDNREKDERINYRRDERRHSRSPSPHRKDYREAENIHILSNRRVNRLKDTDFSTTSMDIVQSPINSPLDGFKRSLADSTINDSELVAQLNTPDESNEPSPAYSQHPQQYYPHVQDVPPENHQSPSSPKRISLDDRINLVLGIEKEPPKPIDTVCTRGPYANSTAPNYDPYGYSRSEYDVYNAQAHQPDGYIPPSYQTPYQPQYYQNQINTDNNVKVLQVGNVIQVVPTEQPVVLPSTPVPKPSEGTPKVVYQFMKEPPPRGRSLRSRCSRERVIQRPRPEDHSRDQPGKLRESNREIIREVNRNRERDNQQKDRTNYHKDERRQGRTVSPHCKDYRDTKNSDTSDRISSRRNDTNLCTKNMNVVQLSINSPVDSIKRSLVCSTSTVSDSKLVIQSSASDRSNESFPTYDQFHSQQYYAHVQDVPTKNYKFPDKELNNNKTDIMRKCSLMLKTGNLDAKTVSKTIKTNNLPMYWAPASSLTKALLPRLPDKSMLVSHGFRMKDKPTLDDSLETRKVLKFADDICSGRTSLTGGARLPSSPPPRKLLGKKRHRRGNIQNKKKLKVQIIHTQQKATNDESSEEDNLPPPPPPPGSPPPYLWPPRIKQPPCFYKLCSIGISRLF